MANPQDFQSLQDQIQASLISTTRIVNQIASEDLGFQRSSDPAVGRSLDEKSSRLLALSRSLLESASSISNVAAPILDDVDDVDTNWRKVVDVVDSLLEKADTSLDEYTGVIKQNKASAVEPAKTTATARNALRTQNLVKPQLAFHNRSKNDDTTPWKPILSSKPHAVLPLVDSLGTFTDEFNNIQHHHPYEHEIQNLQYPEAIAKAADPIPYLPINTTQAIFVDTMDGVLKMLEELKEAEEIAVDLEHHDARSYIGLVSLMQISSRQKDWIVDTLKPWRQELEILNQVFADPKIIKVFHGAFMDIVWLQRDLGLYVTGLFDTYHATKILGYPGHSLAYLLKKFIDFDADKKYQMADWRVRPLPDEMFFYARADTHFLLFIYDNLRNELIAGSEPAIPDQDLMEMALQKSKGTSLLRYQRQIYNADTGKGPGGWYNLLYRTTSQLSSQQFAVFKAIHAWRDKIARADDESTNYILPNYALSSLARLMPTDTGSLMGAVHPISHSVKSRSQELLKIIKSAKASGIDGPSTMEIFRTDTVGAVAKANNILAAKGLTGEQPDTVKLQLNQVTVRSETSRFWGNAFGSSVWERNPKLLAIQALRLAVPMPHIDGAVIEEHRAMASPHLNPEQIETPTAQVEAAEVPASNLSDSIDDGVFNLKSGTKRKQDDLIDRSDEHGSKNGTFEVTQTPTNGETAVLNHDENEKLLRLEEKAARKAARKQKKQALKAARKSASSEAVNDPRVMNVAEEDNEEAEEEEEGAFDYSKAASVLHGKATDTKQNGGRKQKPFDPYTKSADAPKGLRRLQTEKAGKSFTFRS